MRGNSRRKNTALKRLFTAAVLILTVTHILACGEVISVEDVDPPGGGSSSLILSWTAPTTNEDGTVLEDLTGYRLYYGTESGNYSHVLNIGNYTTVEIRDLAPGIWYMSVTAYDFLGNESDCSNEIHHTFY